MKILEMFIIVIIAAVGMFGLIYASSVSTNPINTTDTFGKTVIPSHVVQLNKTNATDPNATLIYQNVTVADDPNNSYNLLQNITAIETQGSGAGIIVVAACVILIIIFAVVVLTRGKYSKNRYRT